MYANSKAIYNHLSMNSADVKLWFSVHFKQKSYTLIYFIFNQINLQLIYNEERLCLKAQSFRDFVRLNFHETIILTIDCFSTLA